MITIVTSDEGNDKWAVRLMAALKKIGDSGLPCVQTSNNSVASFKSFVVVCFEKGPSHYILTLPREMRVSQRIATADKQSKMSTGCRIA